MKDIIIHSATYGGADCTQEIKERVKGGSIFVQAGNKIIGDPNHGTVKHLVVDWEYNGERHTTRVVEGSFLKIPPSEHKKLGIFYSNNHNPRTAETIVKSLKSIEKAAAGKVDILTCVWNSIPENPFQEIKSWTQTSSHLNQLLQILQLLYTAEQKNEYKYVSFLEHDVLYPEGYFDYPEFIEKGTVYVNMNYRGMIKEGFQNRKQNDEPFHQMTMHFKEAITHCETILKNATLTNSGLIEPANLKRKQWMSKHSAIHVNHGAHFTSHHTIFSKQNLQTSDSYWGDIDQYAHLFKA